MDLSAVLDGLVEKVAVLAKELEEAKSALAAGETPVETPAFTQADLDKAAAAGVEAFKAEMLAQYEAQQVAETEGETGFKAMLVPKAVEVPATEETPVVEEPIVEEPIVEEPTPIDPSAPQTP